VTALRLSLISLLRTKRVFWTLAVDGLLLFGLSGAGTPTTYGQSLSLVWSDEFNSATSSNVDTTKWAFDTGNGGSNPGWGNNELEFYSSRTNNAYVAGGLLHIRAQIESTNGFNYTSARLKTQGLFWTTYGRIEWRAKLPAGVGLWPALWMLGTNIDSIGWPGCGEIDVVENNGATITFEQGSIHSGSDATQIYNFTGGNSVTNFNVYDLDWTSNSITWSVNGVAYETQTSWGSSTGNPYPFPFNQPFFLLMNVAVGGSYLGNPSTNSINPSIPGEMVIDYIRVYDYATVSIAVQANPSNGGTVSGGGTYNSGTNVTVCASANASCYSFANWTLNSNVVSTSPCYSLTAASDETLVANFTPLAYYTISTSSSPAGGGSTSGGGTVPCGSNVTVCASAIPCYDFTNWTLNGDVVSTSPCYTFAAASDETLVANFTPLAYYTISTSSSPSAGGSASGGRTVGCGSNMTVCATANPCYNFANWIDQYSNLVSTSACYTFTPNGNANLVANFIPITYTITTSSSPNGSGSISGGGAVICGSNVTVCASPNPCYTFVNWTVNSNVVGTSACYNFTAAGNEVIVANFATISYGGSTGGGLTTLHSFDYNDGAYPIAGLVLGSDSNFYGTTYYGGPGGSGTVFRISFSGGLTSLHSFRGADGAFPYAGLMQASDGNFYGMTYQGGASDEGTVFRITPSGSLTTLHSFDYNDGAYPLFGGLVQGSDSNLYGTTEVGGASGGGTVFRITPGGNLTTLHSFSGPDGVFPIGGLVQGSDNNFYGTTYSGGPGGSGTVFRISSSGGFRSLYSFSGPDGAFPFAYLIQCSDGNFYGTTTAGGTFSVGTVFRISPGGSLTNLWSFSGCSDGASPYAGLVQVSDGNFYGTTYGSGWGPSANGTVFRLDASGHFTNLWSFTGGVDGAFSYATLVQGNDHALYGTTLAGGAYGGGTVFRIVAGLCGSELTPNSADFSSAGGSGSVTVTAASTNCVWTDVCNSGFITITSGSGGTGSGTVSYTVAADTDTNSFGRSGTMTIAGLTFTVTQASLGCSFTLGSTNASFDSAGGSGNVTVSVSGSNCAWTATSNSGFIAITSGSSSGGNGTVNYTVAANTNGFPVTGTMTIAGQTFTVTQGGVGCSAVLTMSSSPADGGITSGGGTVGCGSNVTACATPNACYSFVNWTVNGNAISASACSSFAVASNETLVANFAPIFSLTFSTSSSPAAGGSTSGGGTVACGSNATVCAMANSCYRFVNWTDQNSNIVSALACYTFTATNTETLVANFAPTLPYYTITTSGSPTAGGYADGGRTVACGSTVTVCPVASPCYNFVNWTDQNSNVVSALPCYSFTAVSNETLVANFAIINGGRTSGSVTSLWSFTDAGDGANPEGALMQGSDGRFYGTTYGSGSGLSAYGTVFRITPSGNLTNLWSFTNGRDGANPYASLVQGSDSNFYGTTYGSGAGPSAYGSVFRIRPGGNLTNLWSFTGGTDGAKPYGALVQGSDGNFYGTTSGSGSGPSGNGTVFRITANGSLSNLHSFVGTDGANPSSGLVQGSDGNFYGTTYTGGNGYGTVFRISPSGSLTTLWSFTNGLDGANSYATLVQGGDGNFYGTTSGSGSGPSGYGTVFRISPTGNLTNLWEFTGCGDGGNSYAALVQGSDGNFYGTTSGSGSGPSGYGTVFRISPTGNLTTLHSFNIGVGANPYAPLVQGSDGSFYGTTYQGGTNGNYGTVFRLTVPLNPPANQISGIQLMGTSLVVTIPSVAGETYQLQYSGSLTLSNWNNVSSVSMTNSIGGLLSLTNLGGALQPQGFYRFDITP
jgi:uncharacterized repeat protein (TIGR03803 family)